jgi:hypothetical protein
MESGGSIHEPKRHHQKLEVAAVRVERRFANVVWVHAHLVVATAEVKLGEEPHAAKLIQ